MRRLRLLGLVMLANVLLLLGVEAAMHSGLSWPVVSSLLALVILTSGVVLRANYWQKHSDGRTLGGLKRPRARELDSQPVILVINGNDWVRTVTTALLTSEDFAVFEAKNGEEGLQRARRHEPDVILLGLDLPGKSGLRVLRELKSDDMTKAIPVIVVSAYASSLMNEKDAGQVAGLIDDPFEYDDLIDQVKRAYKLRRGATYSPRPTG